MVFIVVFGDLGVCVCVWSICLVVAGFIIEAIVKQVDDKECVDEVYDGVSVVGCGEEK